jgi:hypothetical protein
MDVPGHVGVGLQGFFVFGYFQLIGVDVLLLLGQDLLQFDVLLIQLHVFCLFLLNPYLQLLDRLLLVGLKLA